MTPPRASDTAPRLLLAKSDAPAAHRTAADKSRASLGATSVPRRQESSSALAPRHSHRERPAAWKAIAARECRLSELGPASRRGGEWLWWWGAGSAPWMPGLIWVRDLVGVGDVMVDGSVRVE